MDRLLENDLAVKIFAVFLAVVLWFQVAREVPQSQKSISGVPVQVRDLPAGLIATELDPATVTVVVRGRGRQFDNLSRDDILALVNLRGVRPGRVSYVIDGVPVPKGVTLVNFTPDQVTVNVERIVEKEMPVHVRLEGEAAGGFVIGVPVVNPQMVLVSGREQDVARVARVEVPARVTGARSTLDFQRGVTLLDGEGATVTELQVAPLEVRVKIPIEPVPAESPESPSPPVNDEGNG